MPAAQVRAPRGLGLARWTPRRWLAHDFALLSSPPRGTCKPPWKPWEEGACQPFLTQQGRCCPLASRAAVREENQRSLFHIRIPSLAPSISWLTTPEHTGP